MAYRNGTYIAFHAEGTTDPTASDIKYFNMMKAWHAHDDIEFRFVNSHEKVAAVRDTSMAETLKRSLRARLADSKNMVLIIGEKTKLDIDWVPFEIAHAIDTCGLPIIAVYPNFDYIQAPAQLSHLWPLALKSRIENRTARVIHIPFNRSAIDDAIRQFKLGNLPSSALEYYSTAAYQAFGIKIG